MRAAVLFSLGLFTVLPSWLFAAEPIPANSFEREVLPILQTFCADCHDGESDNKAQFMTAKSLDDVIAARGSWRNVAGQLINRTMPPADEAQPEEADRIRIAQWIEAKLRETACNGEEYAGCLLYTSPSPRDQRGSRMPSSA